MWFRGNTRKEHPQRPKRFRPHLETLEGRCLPAVTITPGIFQFGNEVVRIVSNNASDEIYIEDNGDALEIEVNGQSRGFFGASELRIVEIYLGGGNDEVHIDFSDLNGEDRSYIINTGAGNDEVLIHLQDDLETETELNFLIIDGGGRDYLEFLLDEVDMFDGSTVKLSAVLGGDNDDVEIGIDGDVADGSSMHFNIDTGNGNDFVVFYQTQAAEVDGAAIDVSIKTGNGRDTVFADFDEDFDNYGNMQFNVNLGSGNDLFEAEFGSDQFDVNEGGGLDGAAFNLTVWGESGDDEIAVLHDDDDETIEVNATVFDIHLYGGSGNDNIDVLFGLNPGGGVGSFTGVGGIVIFVDAGAGRDVIVLLLTADSSSNNRFDVAILAGRGNDDVTFLGLDNGSSPTFLGGGVLLDGGLGRDFRTIEVGTDMNRRRKNFEGGVGDII